MANSFDSGGLQVSSARLRAIVRPLTLAIISATISIGADATPDLRDLAFQQRLGNHLPLDVSLRDQAGTQLRLSDALQGKPLILQLGYFRCPNLCGVVRADLLHALGKSGLVAGRDYTLVSLSIDPAETFTDAAAAKASDLQHFPVTGAQRDLRYVTASADEIKRVADTVGFGDRPDSSSQGQYIHPAGVVFVTRTGVVSGYLLGVGYQSGDLRAAVDRAGASAISAAALPVVLLCYDYDPTTGRYSLAIMKILRLVAVLTVLTVGGLLFLAFRREGRAA
jgi:protein SCO1/2